MLKHLSLTDRRRYTQLAGVWLLAMTFRFGWMMILGRSIFFGDNYSLLVPGKLFTVQWLSRGIVPLWNPYIFSGISWIGDISQSIFYPSTLLFWALPAGTALMVTVILQLAVALVGMYGLAYTWTKHHWASVVAGVLWMLSTQVTGSINNLSTIQSIVWVPMLVWMGLSLGRRRWAIPGFAIVFGLQVFAGYPQHVIFATLLAGVMSLYWTMTRFSKTNWRDWITAWILAGLGGVGLSALAWLPFVPTVLSSTRMLQSTAQAGQGSLDPLMLAKAGLPYIFDKPTAGMKWGPAWSGHPNAAIYVTWLGLAVLAGAMVESLAQLRTQSWRVWWRSTLHKDRVLFVVLLTGCLLFALGSHVPGFTALQQLVPLLRVTRYPSMVLMIANVILALWIAVELPAFKVSRRWQSVLLGAFTIALAAGIIGQVVIRTNFEPAWKLADQMVGQRLSQSVFHTQDRDQVIAQVVSTDLIVVAGLAIVALWALTTKRWTLFTVIITLDLLYNTQGVLFFVPNTVYPATASLSAPFAQLTDPQTRTLTRNSNRPYTAFDSYWEAMVVREPFSDSFVDRFELITGLHAQRLRDGMTPDWNQVAQVSTIQGYTTLLPQDYAQLWRLPDASVIGINSLDPIEEQASDSALASWAVKYYVVDTWFNIQEDLSQLQPVATHQTWQLYELPALARFRYDDNQPVTLLNFQQTPNSLSFTLENSDQHSALRIADRYEPGWQARVNGQVVTIANYQGMRQVPLQPGTNQISLSYLPPEVWWGLAISGVTGILLALGLWRASRR